MSSVETTDRQPTIELIPLSTSNCIDLGVRFYGRHLKQMLTLWLILAGPFCVLVFWLSSLHDPNYVPVGFWDWLGDSGFFLVSTGLFFLTVPMGVMVTAMAAPSALGEPFTLRRIWKQFDVVLRLTLWGCWLRCLIASLLWVCLLPGLWLASRIGFAAENRFFAEVDPNTSGDRTKQVLKKDADTLLGSMWWMLVFFEVLVILTFSAVDWVAKSVLNMPIFFRRIFKPESALDTDAKMDLFFEYLNHDPVVLTLYAAVVLLVYPVVRLAWFFRYVDIRVRRDCWDLQIQFSDEVKTLWEERTI